MMRAPTDENTAIEIHDSTLEQIESQGDAQLVAVLSAYVHRSSGKPDVDGGSGWSQTARFMIGAGKATGSVASVPIWLADGHVQIAGDTHRNMIPLPLAHDGSVRIELCGFQGERVKGIA